MTLNKTLEQIGGCGDGNCKVYIRPGMHTNGGCRCLRRDPIRAERVISAYRAEVDRLTAQLAEAETRRRKDEDILRTMLRFTDELRARIAEREDECFKLAAGVCEYRSGDDHGNPLCLMVRKPIPRNMYPVTAKEPHTHVTDKGTVLEIPEGVECPLCRIASAHAAEGE